MNEEQDKIVTVGLVGEMKTSFLDYSMSVIVARAIPDVRDGLKPVHRRILYTLYEEGMTPDKKYQKSANAVGAVMGHYHPHGDAAIYDTMVRMAQPFTYRHPLVDGHGNFGNIDGDGAAASRYTEAKLSKISMELLRDLNKETVDFMDNYDGQRKEPVVLPSRFPNILVNGKLVQSFSKEATHTAVIAGTGLGKTTSYGIPAILSLAKEKNKRTMIISDPKGEYYRIVSNELKKEGYKVYLLNFRDFRHSEYWNPLRFIYDLYEEYLNVKDSVEVVNTKDGYRNKLNGVIYNDQVSLDKVIDKLEQEIIKKVRNEVDELAEANCPILNSQDPYWDMQARQLFKAYVWGMLEDIGNPKSMYAIDKNRFNYSTMIRIIDSMGDDYKYFSERDQRKSLAYLYASSPVVNNANTTARCIQSSLSNQLSCYNNSSISNITMDNSFDFDIFVNGEPVAFFIDYADESTKDATVLATFIKQVYKYLIGVANKNRSGKLDKQVVFILDEFGNLPEIPNFSNVISACRGRNIFFILILQSYAQLEYVYGKAVSKVIRDNLNMHIFMGTNDPETLAEFSNECGEFTRLSPVSYLNGSKDTIDYYNFETLKRMPKSALYKINNGECIVTEAGTGYILKSQLERFFLCKEYSKLKVTDIYKYPAKVDPYEEKYSFVYRERPRKGLFD